MALAFECGSLLPLFPASLLALGLFVAPKSGDFMGAKRLAFSVEARPSYSSPAGWLGKATAGCSTPKPRGTDRRLLLNEAILFPRREAVLYCIKIANPVMAGCINILRTAPPTMGKVLGTLGTAPPTMGKVLGMLGTASPTMGKVLGMLRTAPPTMAEVVGMLGTAPPIWAFRSEIENLAYFMALLGVGGGRIVGGRRGGGGCGVRCQCVV